MKKLGELLLERGWVDRGELLRAMRQQKQLGGRLGTWLLDMGAVSEEELLHVLGIQHGIDPVSVEEIRQVPEDVRGLLPAKAAIRCKAVPVKTGASKVHVALLDPGDLACQDELSFAIGRRLVLRAVSEVRLHEALERYYDEAMDRRMTELLDRLNRQRFLWRDDDGEAGSEARGARSARGGNGEPTAPPSDSLELFPSGPRLNAPDLPAPPMRRQSAPTAKPEAVSPGGAGGDTEPAPTPEPAPGAEPAPHTAPDAHRPAAGNVEPAASRPSRMSAIKLSENERAALYGGRAPAPVNYDEAEARLAMLESRDAVASLVIDFLRQEFDRVILFAARSGAVTGWAADGEDINNDSVGNLSIPFSQPSIFLNLRQGSAFHLGPLPPLPAHRPLVSVLGGESPDECLVLPVTLGERMVMAIYCDRQGHPLGGIDLEALRGLANAVARALERCILLKRQAQP